MTEIEKKALALVNEVVGSGSWTMTNLSHPYNRVLFQALCRAIEQHEAYKQEVSDAIHKHWGDMPCEFDRFIIPKPVDPLVEVLADAVFTGTGVMKDGKHVPIEDVYLDPRDARIEALEAENERLREALEWYVAEDEKYARAALETKHD